MKALAIMGALVVVLVWGSPDSAAQMVTGGFSLEPGGAGPFNNFTNFYPYYLGGYYPPYYGPYYYTPTPYEGFTFDGSHHAQHIALPPAGSSGHRKG